MTAADRDAAARRQRAQTIALWRWSLIEPAMDPALTSRQRGRVVRDIAGREHAGPFGRTVSVSRKTVDRWITARKAGGFDTLVPAPRQSAPRTDAQVVELAVGLKKENPARTAAQVRRVLIAQLGWAPSERAIQRWFSARELTTRPDGRPPRAYGRFEAEKINEIWTADLMNGPKIGGRACHLAGIIDDHSRFLTGHQFVRRPDAVRFAAVLRAAVQRHGVPAVLYTDHGGCFTDASLARTCAVLGISLVHSQPGKPAGRGKIERYSRPSSSSSWSRSPPATTRPGTRSPAWTSSATCSTTGSARSTTSGRIPRPGRPRRPAIRQPGRLRCRTRRCCARRSAGRRCGWSARPPPLSSREFSELGQIRLCLRKY
jgi:putative transposase